jgi:RNase H-like domain found in reverse transcriptase/Reverse transcriptase (RNA-dependent DNA polymerase)/Integrase zinc binding domain/Chromo (CHRromatin Organisation MOdifier) domain/Domain of unknown function (DUF4939)/Retroviral aspartyl protease/Integrase core domain
MNSEESQFLLEELNKMRLLISKQQQEIQLLHSGMQNQEDQSTNDVQHQVKEPKIAPPEYFEGSRKKSRSFLLQLGNTFRVQQSRFMDDKLKVSYAISFLRGAAFDWIAPYMESNHSLLRSFQEFKTHFLLAFGDVDRKHQAEKEILSLKQGNQSAAVLVSEFQKLALELDWSGAPVCALFYQALRDEVKDELCKYDRPTSIEDYYSMAIRIDNRISERRTERRLSHSYRVQNINSIPLKDQDVVMPDSDAMDVDSSYRRGALSRGERQRRIDGNLCLYCGEAGHLINTCDKRSYRPRSRILGNNRTTLKYCVSSCLNHNENRLYIPLDFISQNRNIQTSALLDSGCDCSLISESFVSSNCLPVQTLQKSVHFEVIDGSPIPTGNPKEFVVCNVKVHDVEFQQTFFVMARLHTTVVLGIDWLRKFNPKIDWETSTVSFSQSSEGVANNNVKGGRDSNPMPIRTEPVTGSSCSMGPPDVNAIKENSESEKMEIGYISNDLCPSIVRDDYPKDNPEFADDYDTEIDDIKKMLPPEYHKFSLVFSKNNSELLPQHRKYDIAIDIMENKTIPWGPIYPLSDPELDTLKKYIDENLEKGFIRPSSSPAGAPLFFVKKKNGELRPVIDYRGLNAITIKNRYPLPLIHEILHRFASARVFTKLDLRGAYNLVRIKEGDEWKTAFRCRYGHFEYCVMPFGLTNAPAVFQHLMNDILREFLDDFCVVYLDDILIYSKNVSDHTDHVQKVLQCLRENSLYAKIEKCKFGVTSVDFLGFIISDTGIGMDPQRIVSITDWPTPKNVKSLQSFLGFANFYRQFVPNFTKIIIPLLVLLKKEARYEWSDNCERAFNQLKSAFTSAPVLKHADTNRPFIVETDASDFAIGGVLSQSYDGLLHPIAYYSRKLSAPEINYEVHDKELLAIVACFYQWRSFLLSNPEPVTVYTDHRNLQYFSSSQKLNRRQVRWSLFLADFNFNLVYRPGLEGGKPDALSRRSDYLLCESNQQVLHQNQVLLSKEKFLIAALSTGKEPLSLLDQVKLAQVEDQSLLELHDKPAFKFEDDCLFYHDRIVVPKILRTKILEICHDSPMAGHAGYRKTFEALSRSFWWPTCRRDCKSYVESCDICARAKADHKKPAGLLVPLPIPPRPWFSISMDLITDLPPVEGMDSILVIVDRFTKMAHFIACSKTMSSPKLADLFIYHIVRLHGFPNNIVSDRGSIFTSQFWGSLLKNYGISQSISTAYHPQTDGQTERVNQCLEQYLRVYSDYKQTNWVKNLSFAELCYNSQFHSAIKMSPFQATYGYEPPLDWSTELIPESPPSLQEYLFEVKNNIDVIREELRLAQDSAKEFADRKRRFESFEIGDQVFVNRQYIKTTRPCLKLDWKKIGPFQVEKKINSVTYRLKLPKSMKKIHNVFHVSLLSPCKRSYPEKNASKPPPIIIDRSGDLFEVEDILDIKKDHGKFQFLVSWKGYSAKDNSWEPEENLYNCEELVEDFKTRFKSKVESAARGATVRIAASNQD